MFKKIFISNWGNLLLLVFFSLGDPILTAKLLHLLQDLYNNTTIGTQRSIIMASIFSAVCVWVLKRLSLYAFAVSKSNFLTRARINIKNIAFDSILQTDKDISENGIGYYVALLTNDISTLEKNFFAATIEIFGSITKLLILSTSFLNLDIHFGMTLICFVPLTFIVNFISKSKIQKTSRSYSESVGRFSHSVNEFINAYYVIKNYSIERKFSMLFKDRNRMAEEDKFVSETALSAANEMAGTISWFTKILVISIGLILLSEGNMQLGTIIAACGFIDEIASNLSSFCSSTNKIRSSVPIIKKIKKYENKNASIKKDERIDEGEFDLTYKNVSVKGIIENFSYTFKKGRRYLIIGESGAGKSTIFKLLKSSQKNSYSGLILAGEKDIHTLKKNPICYIYEAPSLFTGSLKENITCFNALCSDNEVYVSVKEHAKISIPDMRMISDTGNSISSGEARRIEFARALLSDAQILVFDEISSTLDGHTAFDIEKCMLGTKKTIINIAHNFSAGLIKRYDKILLISDGKLVASGSYDELIATNQFFKELCAIKFNLNDNK